MFAPRYKILLSLLLIPLVTAVVFSYALNLPALAAFNQQINYQGKLTNASNVAVADGSYNAQFRLCTNDTCTAGGDPIWTETFCYSPDSGSTCNGTGSDQRVTVTNGLFSVMLGSISTLANVNFNQTLYLGINIGGSGSTPSWDGEMTPRKVLGAVPAAFMAYSVAGGTSTTTAATSTVGYFADHLKVATTTEAENRKLTVGGNSYFAGNVYVQGSATTTGTLDVRENLFNSTGNLTVQDNLQINGAATTTGILAFTGNETPGNSRMPSYGLSIGQSSAYSWLQSYGSEELILNPLGNNVGIGDVTPAQLFTVGSGDKFTVDASGNATTSGYLVVGTTNPNSNLAAGTIWSTYSTSSQATSTYLYTNSFALGPDNLTDITGSGLTITSGALTVTGQAPAGYAGAWQTLSGVGTAITPTSTTGIVVNAASSTITQLVVNQGTTTYATSTNLYSSTLGLNSEYFTDLTGTGLQNSAGVLSADFTKVAPFGYAGAWETFQTNVIRPTSTAAGILINSASSTITNLVTNYATTSNRLVLGATNPTNNYGLLYSYNNGANIYNSYLFTDQTSASAVDTTNYGVYTRTLVNVNNEGLVDKVATAFGSYTSSTAISIGGASDGSNATAYGTYSLAKARADFNGLAYGVYGSAAAEFTEGGYAYGIYGEANSTQSSSVNYGLYGTASSGTTNYAIYASGNTYTSGSATTTQYLNVGTAPNSTFKYNAGDIWASGGVTSTKATSTFGYVADHLKIATTTEAENRKLTVGGTSYFGGNMYTEGNLTVTNSNQTTVFTVGGSAYIGAPASSEDIYIHADATNSYIEARTNLMILKTTRTSDDIILQTNSTEALRVLASNQNVGIGDASPAYLLTVGSGEKFTVDSSGNATTSGYLVVGTSNPNSNLAAGTIWASAATTTNATSTTGYFADHLKIATTTEAETRKLTVGGTSYFAGDMYVQGNATSTASIATQRLAIGTASPNDTTQFNVTRASGVGTFANIVAGNTSANSDLTILNVQGNVNTAGFNSALTGIRSYLTSTANTDISFNGYQDSFNSAIMGEYFSNTGGAVRTHTTVRNFLSNYLLYSDSNTTYTNVVGFESKIYDYGAGLRPNITNFYNFRANSGYGWGATTTNLYGLYVQNPAAGGDITNLYGIYLESPTRGTTNYAIYAAGGQAWLGGTVTTTAATSTFGYIADHLKIATTTEADARFSAKLAVGGNVYISGSATTTGYVTMAERAQIGYAGTLLKWPSQLLFVGNNTPTINNSGAGVGTSTIRTLTTAGASGSVVSALFSEYAPTTQYDQGLAIELGFKHDQFGSYTSRIVNYNYTGSTQATRLVLQTQAAGGTAWNNGILIDDVGKVGIGIANASLAATPVPYTLTVAPISGATTTFHVVGNSRFEGNATTTGFLNVGTAPDSTFGYNAGDIWASGGVTSTKATSTFGYVADHLKIATTTEADARFSAKLAVGGNVYISGSATTSGTIIVSEKMGIATTTYADGRTLVVGGKVYASINSSSAGSAGTAGWFENLYVPAVINYGLVGRNLNSSVSAAGVYGIGSGGMGVYGITDSGQNRGPAGVYGVSVATSVSGGTGVYGIATPTNSAGTAYGVYGIANAAGATAKNYGVYGRAVSGLTNYGVYSEGDFYVSGNATTTLNQYIGGNLSIGTPRMNAAYLQVNNGESINTYTKAQMALSWSGNTSGQYPQFIHTRHNAAAVGGNAIDFYISDGTAAGVFPTNATHVLTLGGTNGQRVGILTTDPYYSFQVNPVSGATTTMDVIGNTRLEGTLTATGVVKFAGLTAVTSTNGGMPTVCYNASTGELVYAASNNATGVCGNAMAPHLSEKVYVATSTGEILDGMVVVADPENDERVAPATTAYEPSVVGVVVGADNKGYVISTKGDVYLALTGRIPVLVTGQNGPIRRGDLITTSNIPGYGMLATEQNAGIYAVALAEFNPEMASSTGKIMAYLRSTSVLPVNPLPVNTATSTGELVVTSSQTDLPNLIVQQAATFYGTIMVYGESNFVAKVTFAKEVEFKDHIIVDRDTAGQVQVEPYQTSTEVLFARDYQYGPRVVLTPLQDTPTSFWVSEQTIKGFRVNIKQTQSTELLFNWIALALNDTAAVVEAAVDNPPTVIPSLDSTVPGEISSTGEATTTTVTTTEVTSQTASSTTPTNAVMVAGAAPDNSSAIITSEEINLVLNAASTVNPQTVNPQEVLPDLALPAP